MLIHALLGTYLKSGCRWCHKISSMHKWFTWHSVRNWKAGQKLKVIQNMSRGKKESRGVHAFYPTWWTVCGEALAAVINNHAELMELWVWPPTVSKGTQMRARIRGAKSTLTTFDFYFGCTLGGQLVRQSDNLGRALNNNNFIHPLFRLN